MDIVEEVIQALGGVEAARQRYGYSERMGVYNWRSRGIPKRLLIDIHLATGIPLDRLNPQGVAAPQN